MIFEYTVKHNGVYYPAGTDVPVGEAPKDEPVKEIPEEVEAPKPKKRTAKR